jgi:hypothetical protein
MVHAIGRHYELQKFQLDVRSAFFSSEDTKKTNMWVLEPPQMKREDGLNRWRQLWKEVPGTKGAPRAFYDTLQEYVTGSAGFMRSKHDRCIFMHFDDMNGELDAVFATHVDDAIGFATPEVMQWLKQKLEERFELTFQAIEHERTIEFAGLEWTEHATTTEITQAAYIQNKLQPVSIAPERKKQREETITDEERSAMRSTLGAWRWCSKTIVDTLYDLNRLSTWVSMDECTVDQINRMNKCVQYMKQGRAEREADGERRFWGKPKIQGVSMPVLPREAEVQVTFIVDAGEPSDDAQYRGKWHGMVLVGLQVEQEDTKREDNRWVPIHWRSSLTKRVAHGSFDGEALVFIEGLDVALSVALLWEEFQSGVKPSLWQRKILGTETEEVMCKVMCEGHSDSNDLVKASKSLVYAQGYQKRRKTDVCDIQELQTLGLLKPLVHISGKKNPGDAGTKKLSHEAETMVRLREAVQGYYRPIKTETQEKKKEEGVVPMGKRAKKEKTKRAGHAERWRQQQVKTN